MTRMRPPDFGVTHRLVTEHGKTWIDYGGIINRVEATPERLRGLGYTEIEDDEWHWLASTRKLQVEAYHDDDWPKQGDALAASVQMNVTALVVELGEAAAEVGWKPWAQPQGWVNREAYLKELVDVGHFLANLLVAVGCTDEEWERLYRAKQELNTRRQVNGYDGVEGKCHICHRALDDDGLEQRENPRHQGVMQWVCKGCGAVQDLEVVATVQRAKA